MTETQVVAVVVIFFSNNYTKTHLCECSVVTETEVEHYGDFPQHLFYSYPFWKEVTRGGDFQPPAPALLVRSYDKQG